MLLKQKTTKMKVSLKQFQQRVRRSPKQVYQPTYVSSHIQWAQQQSQAINQYFPQSNISRITQNQRHYPRKKIFCQKSRSKSPYNHISSQKNQNTAFVISQEYNTTNPQLPSIHSFGKISQQKYHSQGSQNSHPSPFSSKLIHQQAANPAYNTVADRKKYNKADQVIQLRNNYQKGKEFFNALQYEQLKRKICQIQKEVKQIHNKIDERSVDQNSWRRQLRSELIQRQNYLLNKQLQLKRNLSKMEQPTRISYGSKNHQNSTVFSPRTLNKSHSLSQLQLARTKRLQQLSRQNNRLKNELAREASTLPAVMQDFGNFANDRQFKYSEYDSIIYTNEQKLKMKLNSISALPKIKDEDEYSQDERALGQLLSPFAFDPDGY